MDISRRRFGLGALGASLLHTVPAYACLSETFFYLCGDSIFDNNRYVNGPGVIEQLNAKFENPCARAIKLAVDGDKTRDVWGRIESYNMNYPPQMIFLSVGGNDALENRHLLDQVSSREDLDRVIEQPLEKFRQDYDDLVGKLANLSYLPGSKYAYRSGLTVSTIYTAIPFGNEKWETFVPMALEAYNQVIMETAEKYKVRLLRLDRLLTKPEDFSEISPIEPSEIGGDIIATALYRTLSAKYF